MPALADAPAGPPEHALHTRAMDNLAFIRDTMARAAPTTAVSGAGIAASGVIGIAAAAVTARMHDGAGWTTTWLLAAALAGPLSAGATAWKARGAGRLRGTPVLPPSTRRLLLSFLPPFAVGALLTAALVHVGVFALLPALWLLSYGAGISTGGAFSVRALPVMGLVFLALGVVALLGYLYAPATPGQATAVTSAAAPDAWGNACMVAGFGLAHLGFGAYVARRHGG